MLEVMPDLSTLADAILDLAVQGFLVLLAATLSSRVVARRQPAASHAITVAACVGLLLLPLCHPWSGRLGLIERTTGRNLPTISGAGEGIDTGAAPREETLAVQVASAPSTSALLPPAAALSPEAPVEPPSASVDDPGVDLRLLALTAWAAGLLVVVLAWWRDSRALRHLLARCRPAGHELERLLDELVRRTRSRRRPVLLVSDEIDAPAMAGHLRPCVILPRALAEGLDRRLLSPLILHELAHLERGDVLIDRLTRLVCALHWFQPLAWSVRRTLGRQREILTDARVVEIEASRADYAEGLLDVLRRRPAPAAGIGLGGGPARSIAERLEILLHRPVRAGTSRPLRAVIVLALVLGLIGASRLGFESPAGAIGVRIPGALDLVPSGAAERDVAQALAEARDWLVRNQSEDGAWRNGDLEVDDAMVPGWTALGSLALMAGPGPEPRSAQRKAIDRGISRLLSLQGPKGDFGSSSNASSYSQVLGLICLARYQARGFVEAIDVKSAISRAQTFLLDAQNPYAGWRYGSRSGDNDSSLTGWGLLALDATRRVGITVDPMRLDWGLRWIDSMTDEETGRTGYVSKGATTLRNMEVAGKFPCKESESLTAMAILVRARCRKTDDPERRDRALALLSRCPPAWDVARGSIDYFYWLLGSQASLTLEAGDERRVAWQAALASALLEGQIVDGKDRGAWPAKDPWSKSGGLVYTTAFAVLSLIQEPL